MFFHGKLETSSADCLEDPSLGLCTNVWLLFFGRLISLFQGSCRGIDKEAWGEAWGEEWGDEYWLFALSAFHAANRLCSLCSQST